MNGMILEGNVRLVNTKAKFKCSVMNKDDIIVDYIPPLGDGEGYTSLELLLLSLASCFGSTVKFVLNQKLDIRVKDLEVDIRGKRKAEHPTGFSEINLDMKIRADKLTSEILENVIKTSEETLCPVYSMISNAAVINVNYSILHSETASYCGVYCRSCPLYIGTEEEPERLEYLSKLTGKSINELECRGCRSDKLSYYCADCKLKSCAEKGGYGNCTECGEYPCSELKLFQTGMPHRAELWESLEILKDRGFEKWDELLEKDFSCSKCGTINTAYDINCRKCNNYPGSNFTEKHKGIIIPYLEKSRIN